MSEVPGPQSSVGSDDPRHLLWRVVRVLSKGSNYFLTAFCFLETTVEGLGAVQCDSLRRTIPPVGPGTAPWTKTRFFSLETLTTSRLRLETFSWPQWPAIFLPG